MNLNICLVHVRLTLFCLHSLWQPLFRLQPHATNSNMCFMYHISVDQWGNHCIPSTSIPIHSDPGRLGMILNMTSFIVLRCSRKMLQQCVLWEVHFRGPLSYYGYHFISLIVGENMFNCTMCILTAALDVHHWKSSWLLGSKKKKQYSEQERSNNSHCCKMQARVPECELFILAFISLLRNWWNY